MNVTVIGGMGRLGKAIAEQVEKHYAVRVADRRGGETVEEATRDAEIVIVIVDTPSLRNGRYDVRNVVDACARIDLSTWRMVIVSCTINPGDTEGAIRQALERDTRTAHVHFGLAYVPEFVRQGSVANDLAAPPFIVAGCETERERDVLGRFYWTLCRQHPQYVSVQSAEIAKIGLNTALTMRLAKANEIAWLCQYTPGADANEVLAILRQDPRVGSLYFKAGPPDGGPCLPRDDAAFGAAMQMAGIASTTPRAVACWRDQQVFLMVGLLLERKHRRPGVVGLGFKPGVADETESAALKVANILAANTYDPVLPCNCDTLAELVEQSDVILLATPFPGMDEIVDLDLDGKRVIDWWGTFGDRFERFGKGPML